MSNKNYKLPFDVMQHIVRVWRLQTVPLALWTFRKVNPPYLLERPFFGFRLLLDVARSNAQKLLFLEGERFVRERTLLSGLLKPGMCAVDVGANIGYYALM